MVSNRLISSRHRLTTLTTLTAPLVLIFPPASPLSATKGTTPTPLESPTRAHPLSCASHWFSGVTDVTGAPTDWLVDAINGFYTLLWVSNAATWRPRDVAMAAWRQSLSTHTHTHTYTLANFNQKSLHALFRLNLVNFRRFYHFPPKFSWVFFTIFFRFGVI